MSKMQTVRVIKPSPEYVGISDAAPESLIRRIEAMVRMSATPDRDLSSPLAKMRMRDQIPKHHFEAVQKLLRQRTAYLRAIDAKGIKSASAEAVGKSEPPDPMSDAGRKVAARDARAVTEYDRAMRAVSACGREQVKLFKEYALEWPEGQDGHAPGYAVAAIRIVAKALHEHYYLSRRRSQRESRG